MTTCCLPYEYRIETGTFEEYIGRSFGDTAFQSTEYSGNTHRFFGIAYHQVVLVQFTFDTVECCESGTCRKATDDHFISFDFIFIERVQGLSQLEKNEIRNIYHIVDRV